MAKFEKDLPSENVTPQLPFPAPADGALDLLIRQSIATTINGHILSIDEIAERMSAWLETPITAAMLRKYAAPSKAGYRFPLGWVIGWVRVTGDRSLLDIVLDAYGTRMLEPGESALIDYARAKLKSEIQAEAAEQAKRWVIERGVEL